MFMPTPTPMFIPTPIFIPLEATAAGLAGEGTNTMLGDGCIGPEGAGTLTDAVGAAVLVLLGAPAPMRVPNSMLPLEASGFDARWRSARDNLLAGAAVIEGLRLRGGGTDR